MITKDYLEANVEKEMNYAHYFDFPKDSEAKRRRVEGHFAEEGTKFDDGKDPWHLLPTDALRGITKVLGFGARKYEERNWEKGMKWSRVYGATLRHLTSWFEGERRDPETGYSHLWHAGCCILFLITYEMRGLGEDDRPLSKTRSDPFASDSDRSPFSPGDFMPYPGLGNKQHSLHDEGGVQKAF